MPGASTSFVGPLGSTIYHLRADAATVAAFAGLDRTSRFRRVCLDPVRGVVVLMAPLHLHEGLTGFDDIVDGAASELDLASIELRSARLRGKGEPPGRRHGAGLLLPCRRARPCASRGLGRERESSGRVLRRERPGPRRGSRDYPRRRGQDRALPPPARAGVPADPRQARGGDAPGRLPGPPLRSASAHWRHPPSCRNSLPPMPAKPSRASDGAPTAANASRRWRASPAPPSHQQNRRDRRARRAFPL